MDDRNAFDRQIAREVLIGAGPTEPVDDLAVFDAVITATESPKWRFWPRAMPSAHGDNPTVTGRTYTMFSPVNAIIAGAIVALGSLLLVAQPLGQQEVSVPGALPEGGAVLVTITQDCAFSSGECTFTASDPRLTGPGTMKITRVVSTNEATPILAWGEYTLDGPDGTWSGYNYGVADDEGSAHVSMVLSGAGAYEGWQYVASGIDPGADGDHDLIGVLYEGTLPPMRPLVPDTTE
jgi:hypothetical protein